MKNRLFRYQTDTFDIWIQINKNKNLRSKYVYKVVFFSSEAIFSETRGSRFIMQDQRTSRCDTTKF